MGMTDAIQGLAPQPLWSLFARISAIPHGSKNEAALASHLRLMAEKAGLRVQQDDAGNLCIAVPPSPGCEKAPAVVLQAHLDMVCEKNASVAFDFARDAIRLVRDGDWMKADGTSLGADNGIGMAGAMAVAVSRDILHGPLEVLLTVDEETGLTGAVSLSPSLVRGRILLNLDSEKSDHLCIGCAGGGEVATRLPLTLTDTPPQSAALTLTLTGLRGGHSGLDIHENRANAVTLMALLVLAMKDHGALVADFQGGDKHNAIPRESFATVVLPAAQLRAARESLAARYRAIASECAHETAMQMSCAETALPARVAGGPSSAAALHMLAAFPHGVLAMSRYMPGLVETSSNLAAAHMREDLLTVHNMARSSVSPALHSTMEQIAAISSLAGGTCELETPYPGWQPDPHSKILSVLEKTYEEICGGHPERTATHAGLECGVIGEKCPGMDMISFGPDIINAHSPDEAVNIKSVATFWNILIGALRRIATGAYA
jgi:dipeptidase D